MSKLRLKVSWRRRGALKYATWSTLFTIALLGSGQQSLLLLGTGCGAETPTYPPNDAGMCSFPGAGITGGCPSSKSGTTASSGTGGCAGAGMMVCDGGCVDTSTDVDNCGACGTVCKGAACSAGKCLSCQSGANPGCAMGQLCCQESPQTMATCTQPSEDWCCGPTATNCLDGQLAVPGTTDCFTQKEECQAAVTPNQPTTAVQKHCVSGACVFPAGYHLCPNPC